MSHGRGMFTCWTRSTKREVERGEKEEEKRDIKRNVQVQVLLEESKNKGGSVCGSGFWRGRI